MAEDQTTVALSMDRGLALGNSLDTFNRRALHTKIGNKIDEPIPVTQTGSTQNRITNFQVITANFEYSHALLPNLKQMTIRCRGLARLQYAFNAGESSTKFITIPPCVTKNFGDLLLQSSTLFFQLNKGGEVVEIEEWA